MFIRAEGVARAGGCVCAQRGGGKKEEEERNRAFSLSSACDDIKSRLCHGGCVSLRHPRARLWSHLTSSTRKSASDHFATTAGGQHPGFVFLFFSSFRHNELSVADKQSNKVLRTSVAMTAAVFGHVCDAARAQQAENDAASRLKSDAQQHPRETGLLSTSPEPNSTEEREREGGRAHEATLLAGG